MMANRQDFERILRPSDLLLVPPIPRDMGLLDWNRHSEISEMAYSWGLKEVASLRAQGHPALDEREP
jgi:hypothetical protein